MGSLTKFVDSFLLIIHGQLLPMSGRQCYFLFLDLRLHRYAFLIFVGDWIDLLELDWFRGLLCFERWWQYLMLIFLELFKSIFEFEKVEAMVGVEVADSEILRYFLLLFEYLLDL